MSSSEDVLFTRPTYDDIERPVLIDIVDASVRKVLDVGCNTGKFGLALKSKRSIEVWGVEPNMQSARIAEGRLDRVIVDIFKESNPIPDAYFDLVTFNDSLEHMMDPGEALALAYRKLKPGGTLNCCVPNVRHIENLEHLLIDKDWKYESAGVRDRTHLRFFTKKSIERLINSLGYNIKRSFGINEDWWDKSKKIRRVLFRLFPRHTNDLRFIQIVVIATKPDRQ